MALDREALVVALLDRLKERVAGVNLWSRRALAPQEITVPTAVLLLQRMQSPKIDSGLPPVWDLDLEVVAIVVCERADESPDTKLNAMVKEIEEALALQPGESQPLEGGDELDTTLDGRAVWCRISGDVETLPGQTNGQGIAIVPITIRAWQ